MAKLAKCRHENFCSQFLRVASVESTRIYEKLVAKKVKDTPLGQLSSVELCRYKHPLTRHRMWSLLAPNRRQQAAAAAAEAVAVVVW